MATSDVTSRIPAAVALCSFLVVTALVAIWSRPSGVALWPMIVVLVILGVGAAAMTFGTNDPLALRFTIVACVALPASVLVMLATEPRVIETSTPPWLLSAVAILCIILCLRGRFLLAWVSFAGCYVLIFVWSGIFSEGRPETLLLVLIPGRLFIGTAFAAVLRRSMYATETLNQLETAEVAREAAALAARDERLSRLADLESMVRPMLTRIADGERMSEADMKTCALLEGQLRDQIQAASLANAAVVGNARAARRRGVDVVMIDDGGLAGTPPEVHRRVTQHVNEVLHSANGGHLRIRVLPPGRSNLISIYRSDEKSGTMRIDLDVHGDPASHLAS